MNVACAEPASQHERNENANGKRLCVSTNPLLEQLGYPADARLVIFHEDDVGMCHGSNVAFLDLVQAGILTCGSVMMPCPWASEILLEAQKHPEFDLGVHITFNSEWFGYRWGPLSTRDPASGLVDEDGWFWHRPPMTMEHLNIPAAIAEMDAQIAYAHRYGLDFTHIDAHMGAAVNAPLLPHYIELGFAHKVPVLLTREVDDDILSLSGGDAGANEYRELVASVEARGMPLVDRFRITPGYDKTGKGGEAEYYETVLRELAPGVTFFSLHPNAPGEIESLTPLKAHWRTFEHQYFQSDRLRDFLQAEGIVPIGYREIREVMRNASCG